MGTLIYKSMSGGKPVTAVYLVESPDDDGFYLEKYDFVKERSTVSVQTWDIDGDARVAWHAGDVAWEPWR